VPFLLAFSPNLPLLISVFTSSAFLRANDALTAEFPVARFRVSSNGFCFLVFLFPWHA